MNRYVKLIGRASVPVAIAVSLSVGAAASAAPAAGGAATAALSAITIDNFGKVDDHYYRGGQPDRREYEELSRLGVKTVIDLQADGHEREKSLVEHAGMAYYKIPLTTQERPSDAAVKTFLSLVDDPARQPVYVHCAGGQHRTGVMTAVYRMTNDGWTPDQAFAEMKKFQFGVDFLHPEFKKFVYEFRPGAKPSVPTVLATQVQN